jgi:hypothetical protein
MNSKIAEILSRGDDGEMNYIAFMFKRKNIKMTRINISSAYCPSLGFIDTYMEWLDMEFIMRINTLPIWFIEKNANRFNWEHMAIWQRLPEAFIEKHISRLNRDDISRYPLSDAFIEKYADHLNWELLSGLKISTIEKHLDKFDWDTISMTPHLPVSFLEKYADKLNWDLMSRYQKLPEYLIASKPVNWLRISRYQILSESFIEEHLDTLCLWAIPEEGQVLSEAFMEKYFNKLRPSGIFGTQALSEAFIERHMNTSNVNLCYAIARYQVLSEAFIEKYEKFLDMEVIAMHQKLSEAFIEGRIDILTAHNIMIYQHVSDAFLDKHWDKLSMELQSRRALPASIALKHTIPDGITVKWTYAALKKLCINADIDMPTELGERLVDKKKNDCRIKFI